MSRRVDALTRDNSEFFHVSKEWCLAINNIDYIRQSLPSFIKVNTLTDHTFILTSYRI